MKNPHRILAKPRHAAACSASLAAAILMALSIPTAALAAPPATVASCDGIKAAYPILGTQCATAYTTVNHQPGNAAERLASFGARKTVLQIFQKTVLCNGMFGATSAAQQVFLNGEAGHLQALDNLRTAMVNAHDPNIPAAYTATDLKSISINKPQCK